MKTAIYGAGEYGKNLFLEMSKKIKVDFFIDKYNHNRTVFDIPVLSLSEIPNDCIIYNSLILYEDEIKEDLQQYKVISFVDALKQFPETLKYFIRQKYLWFENCQNIDYKKLDMTKDLFDDEISITFLENWIKFRETLDMNFYPYPTNSLKDQYFIEEFKYSERFVDCGAFNGDTIKSYYKNNGKNIISFEPDPKNLQQLNKIAKNKNVLVYPMGVYDKTTILKFVSQGSGGKIDNTLGDINIPVTTLDETIYNFKPDYIKMDVEGAEYKALIGAKNIIKNFSPNLAISLYHKSNDLWEIPLLIKEINPNYTFKIRCHANMALETVLYCKRKD